MADDPPLWAPTTSPANEPYLQLREGAINNDITLLQRALQANVSINALFPRFPGEGTTALHEAASRGNVDAVRYLIAAGAEIDIEEFSDTNQFDEDKPLYCAAKGAHSEVVRVLLEAGADPSLLGSGDNTPFAAVLDMPHFPTELNGAKAPIDVRHIATILAFIDHGLDLNDRDNFMDLTITEHAVRLADVPTIEWLFALGASRDGLLSVAAAYHKDTAILEFLVGLGVRDVDGKALYEASRLNKPALVEFLLPYVENPSIAESIGALHIAASQGYHLILEMLLRSGLSANARSSQGHTPLIALCNSPYTSPAGVKMLIEYGAHVNIAADDSRRTPCSPGDTPLHASVLYCIPAVLSLLLDSGANVYARNSAGETPLLKLAAAMTGSYFPSHNTAERVQGLRMLLEAGSEVDARSNDDKSALLTFKWFWLLKSDKYLDQAVKLLLARPVDEGI